MILVVFGGVVFLVPLAIYCLVLGILNRRWHPTLVSGPWDFTGVLFALSGFLVVGGPCLLTGLNKQWRALWLTGQLHDVGARSADWWRFWISLWVAYFVVVVAGAAFLLWQRRRTLAIYNISPQQLDDVLHRVLGRLGFVVIRVADQFLIHAKKDSAVEPDAGGPFVPAEAIQPVAVSAPAEPLAPAVDAVLRMDAFPALRHATLTWSGADGVTRKQVELELEKQLAETAAPESPVSGWLLTIAASLLSIAFVCVLLLVGSVVLMYAK